MSEELDQSPLFQVSSLVVPLGDDAVVYTSVNPHSHHPELPLSRRCRPFLPPQVPSHEPEAVAAPLSQQQSAVDTARRRILAEVTFPQWAVGLVAELVAVSSSCC